MTLESIRISFSYRLATKRAARPFLFLVSLPHESVARCLVDVDGLTVVRPNERLSEVRSSNARFRSCFLPGRRANPAQCGHPAAA